MISFTAAGTDLAGALDNALLFCDSRAEYLPGVVLVELTNDGVAFSAHDDYATGQDFIGIINDPAAFELLEADAEAIVKAARSARKANVTLTLTDDSVCLMLDVGSDHRAFYPTGPREAWNHLLPLLEPVEDPAPLPPVVAFNPARLTRFGRVKGAKDAPVDIRFHQTESGAPIALVKVGPSFRGELQGINRTIAKEFINDDNCFW